MHPFVRVDKNVIMPFSVGAFITCKADITPTAFKAYYECAYLWFIQDTFALTLSISYPHWCILQKIVENAVSDFSKTKYSPIILSRPGEHLIYDLYFELLFEDEKAFEAFFTQCLFPGMAAQTKQNGAKYWRVRCFWEVRDMRRARKFSEHSRLMPCPRVLPPCSSTRDLVFPDVFS